MSVNSSLISFTTGKIGYRLSQGRWQQEPLVKICGITTLKKPSIIDCTAGLGHDALLLAQAGSVIIAFEASPLIATALTVALEQARSVPHLTAAVHRLQLIPENAVFYLTAHRMQADFVYCDPMFPHINKSAKAHGAMQWLQSLVKPPTLEEEQNMLSVARHTALQWVVIKRPRNAPNFALLKPHHVYTYRTCRFDLYCPLSFVPEPRTTL